MRDPLGRLVRARASDVVDRVRGAPGEAVVEELREGVDCALLLVLVGAKLLLALLARLLLVHGLLRRRAVVALVVLGPAVEALLVGG